MDLTYTGFIWKYIDGDINSDIDRTSTVTSIALTSDLFGSISTAIQIAVGSKIYFGSRSYPWLLASQIVAITGLFALFAPVFKILVGMTVLV